MKYIIEFVSIHRNALRANGSIVAGWRVRSGHKCGPYYRLTCRDAEGRQKSVYLAGAENVAEARRLLAELQADRQQELALVRALRRAHRAAQSQLDRQLQIVGLHRKGTEIRGCRKFFVRSGGFPPPGSEVRMLSADQTSGKIENC